MKLIMQRFRKVLYNFIPNYLFKSKPIFYTKDAKRFLPTFAWLHIFIKKFYTFLFTIYKKVSSLTKTQKRCLCKGERINK